MERSSNHVSLHTVEIPNVSIDVYTELGVGQFLINPTPNFWTQRNPLKPSPYPTQTIIDTRHNKLITKFSMRTVLQIRKHEQQSLTTVHSN